MTVRPVQRLEDEQHADDPCWTLTGERHACEASVPQQSEVCFRLWDSNGGAPEFVGRFRLDLQTALDFGLVVNDPEKQQIRVHIERNGGRIYLGCTGRGAPSVRLPTD